MVRCVATLPILTTPMWECDGQNLMVMMAKGGPMTVKGRPIVVRHDLIAYMIRDSEGWAWMFNHFGVMDFTGGDHVHATWTERNRDAT